MRVCNQRLCVIAYADTPTAPAICLGAVEMTMACRSVVRLTRDSTTGEFCLLKPGSRHGTMNATDSDIFLLMFGGYD